MTTHEIAQRVERGLRSRRAQLGKTAYRAVEEGIRQEDDFWYVPVEASREPANTARYFEILADIETELFDKDELNVLIIPMYASSTASSSRSARMRQTR